MNIYGRICEIREDSVLFFYYLSCTLESVFLDRSDRLTTAGSLSICRSFCYNVKKVFYKARKIAHV